MKFIAAAILGGLMVLAGPALAQDKDKAMSGMPGMQDKSDAPVHHAARRTRYKRDYKTDHEEEQQTEALNRQYRGVPDADAH
jgi:hypothetical protein